jgi:hypothetical protein
VTFGTDDNFRMEYLSFEVADFKSSSIEAGIMADLMLKKETKIESWS